MEGAGGTSPSTISRVGERSACISSGTGEIIEDALVAPLIEDSGDLSSTPVGIKRKSEPSLALGLRSRGSSEEAFQTVKRRHKLRTTSEPGLSIASGENPGSVTVGRAAAGGRSGGSGVLTAEAVADVASFVWPEKALSLLKNRYKPNSLAPFTVFIEHLANVSGDDHVLSKSPSRGVLALARKLYGFAASYLNAASDFRRTGRGRFSLNFASYLDANNFVNTLYVNSSNVFQGEVWFAYIPHYKVFKQVVARGIDLDLDPEFIMDNLRPYPRSGETWVGPLRIERLTRRIRRSDSSTMQEYGPSGSVLLTFDTTGVPERAVLLGKNIIFSSFVPRVRRCSICLRFGHTGRFCKGSLREPLCDRCGESGHLGISCPAVAPRCINCVREGRSDISHSASDGKCPVFLFNREVRHVMSSMALDFRDAKEFVKVRGPLAPVDPKPLLPTFYDYLPPVSDGYFPQLKSIPLSYAEVVKNSRDVQGSDATVPGSTIPPVQASPAPPPLPTPVIDQPPILGSRSCTSPSPSPGLSAGVRSRIPITDRLALRLGSSPSSVPALTSSASVGRSSSDASSALRSSYSPLAIDSFKDILAKGLFRVKNFKELPLAKRIKIDQVSAKLVDSFLKLNVS